MEVLHVKQLSKQYGETDALRHVDLVVREGEIVSLLGPSGCGKSTLLRIVAGLENGYTGNVHIAAGRPNGAFDSGVQTEAAGQIQGAQQRAVGVVFQEPRLFPWLTVRQNIGFGEKADPEAVTSLAETVGLGDFLHAYPKQLSGGMAQRCSIARALLSKPRLLLLDEPFSALDVFTRMHLHALILRIRDTYNTTMLLVTHDIREALYLSDRVVVMSDRPGRVLKEIDIDLPQPREQVSDVMTQLEKEILNTLDFGMASLHGWKEKIG